jgi:molybdenum cofactor sulfurtransferase
LSRNSRTPENESNDHVHVYIVYGNSLHRNIVRLFILCSVDGGVFAYTQENHTSIFGARGLASDRGATVFCLDADDLIHPENTSSSKQNLLSSTSSAHSSNTQQDPAGASTRHQLNASGNGLFAYPAQCNFSGRKFPLTWASALKTRLDVVTDDDKENECSEFRRRLESQLTTDTSVSPFVPRTNESTWPGSEPTGGAISIAQLRRPRRWFTLLDAASFAATNPLRLSSSASNDDDVARHGAAGSPDFVCVSFYKIFGFPTGLGALLVRRDSAEAVLVNDDRPETSRSRCKRYFGGGTVSVSLTRRDYVRFRPQVHER